jgi:hypothetical protein
MTARPPGKVPRASLPRRARESGAVPRPADAVAIMAAANRAAEAALGLGRIVALHYHSSTAYQIR